MRSVAAASVSGLVAIGLIVSTQRPARAAPGDGGDGAYGRLAGDVTVVTGVGAGVVAGTARTEARPFAAGDLRLRYLDAAGVSVSYEEADALGRASEPGAIRRALLAGVELRPLFPVRFFKGQQTGARFLDLVVDSIALDVGTWWSARRASDVDRPGFYLGTALELPITGEATGLWLRLAGTLRWSSPRLEGEGDPGGRVFALGVGLAWHQVVGPLLVQRGDAPLR